MIIFMMATLTFNIRGILVLKSNFNDFYFVPFGNLGRFYFVPNFLLLFNKCVFVGSL